MVAETPYGLVKDNFGVPVKVEWKPFYSNLPPPMLRGPGGFGKLPPLRKSTLGWDSARGASSLRASPVSVMEESAALEPLTPRHLVEELPSDPDVEYWFKKIKEKVATRFSELRRAFRTIDDSGAGAVDLATFKKSLPFMLNLAVPERIMARLAAICDFDGNGMINFAEFARLLTAESLTTIKQTLQVT